MIKFVPLEYIKGDRPNVIPKGSKNFGFIGQYSEVESDCVFTVGRVKKSI